MKKANPTNYLILLQILLLCLCSNSFGQGIPGKYALSGTVYDQSTNEKLPGVKFILKGVPLAFRPT